ncbi:MAG TPA: NAD(P)/FAD-dependent oxidoreductase [Candidatus Sulfotelmatobacter sp.]|nr:NAD(P)/FAD-dependent oxidoreductase [Candidatus Sulfotelmatobacter sp.]
MSPVSNAVVVGAGPTGCFAAIELAKHGVDTTVFEEHSEIGLPSHCAGHLSIRSLKNLGLYSLPNNIIENTFSNATFYSPSGSRFSVHLKQPVTCTLNRELFDKFLAEKAQAAGARFRLNSRVSSLLVDNGTVVGINVEKANNIEKVPAKIVVDAEGVGSRLLKETDLSNVSRKKLVYSVEAEIENVQNIDRDTVEVFLGKDYASGFYAWIIPLLDETAKVGLATNVGNPKVLLQKLMAKHPVASKQFIRARIRRITFHSIPLSGIIQKAYTDGFLAVGDAASQVKPTTGGGVIFGLTCAQIAADVASEAINKSNVSSNFLQQYQKRCIDKLGFDFRVMLQVRKFLDSLSDEKLDHAINVFNRLGVDKALSDVEEIDFQGRLFLQLLMKPAAIGAIAYFLLLYLSTNP